MTGRQAIITIAIPALADDDATDDDVAEEIRADLAGLAWDVVDVYVDPGPPVPYRRPT